MNPRRSTSSARAAALGKDGGARPGAGTNATPPGYMESGRPSGGPVSRRWREKHGDSRLPDELAPVGTTGAVLSSGS